MALEGDLPLTMESEESEKEFCQLFMRDQNSGLLFLVDLESSLCMFPRKSSDQQDLKCEYWTKLTPDSLDTVLLELDFSLNKKFRWSFIMTDVGYPVIGVDFLDHYKLEVDIENKLVVDQETNSTTKCETLKEIIFYPPPQYEELLKEFPRLTRAYGKCTVKHDIVHHIHTTSGPPVTARPKQLPADIYDAALDVFNKMLESGLAVRSSSPWSSPLVFLPKHAGGIQLGGDYRALNGRTMVDRYPLPNIEDFTKTLHGKKIFSNITVFRTYNQIPISKRDICKTAVLTPFGLFEFPKMCFGLRNTAQTYQRFIDRIINGLDFVFGYLNTILVASTTENEHFRHLKIIFRRLDSYGVTLDLSKCVFGEEEINFLGYSFSIKGTAPSKDKVEMVVNFPKPEIVQQMREFVGMVNFYRRFIPKAGEIIKPLNVLHLAPKSASDTVEWTPQAEEAFETIKKAFNNAKAIPHPVYNAELSIMCCAGSRSVTATLQQNVNGNWQPLSFFTKLLTFSQRNYNAYDRALYCIYAAIRKFHYLLGMRHFIIFTDHKPVTLAFSRKSNKHSSRQFSFLDFIGQFSTDIRFMEKCLMGMPPEDDDIPQVSMPMPLADNLFPLLPQTDDCSNTEQPSGSGTSTATGSLVLNLNASEVESLPLDLSDEETPTKHEEPTPAKNESKGGAKSQRQNKGLPICFPTGKFEHVHLDLIGPLPEMRGFTYCLSCIDRSSRWPEVVPMENIEDETIARAFIFAWVSRFGVPGRITTNRGIDFDTLLFQQLFKILGISHSRITTGAPDDGMELYQKQLESAIKCQENESWLDALPIVLLGMRTAIKKDIDKAPTELLYGSTVRLPQEFFQSSDLDECMSEFVDNLCTLFVENQPRPTRDRNCPKPFIYADLRRSSHVYVRVGGMHRSLHPVFDGPYKLVQCSPRLCIVEKYGQQDMLPAKQLKPAHFHKEDDGLSLSGPAPTV